MMSVRAKSKVSSSSRNFQQTVLDAGQQVHPAASNRMILDKKVHGATAF
jgi:hypothetical protein